MLCQLSYIIMSYFCFYILNKIQKFSPDPMHIFFVLCSSIYLFLLLLLLPKKLPPKILQRLMSTSILSLLLGVLRFQVLYLRKPSKKMKSQHIE